MSGLFAASSGAGVFLYTLVVIAVSVLEIVALWRVFTKAGRPGWASIIPIYNLIVLLEIVNKPLWWVILFFIPIANVVMAFLVYIDLAKMFGRGAGFGVGLVLLPVIFFPILGFGDDQYRAARQGAMA